MAVLNAGLRLQDAVHHKHLGTGMVARGVVTLDRDEKIYRFASSSTIPAINRAAAPWWWQRDEFVKMIPLLQLDPANAGMIARRIGAIKFGWGSRVDILLEAIIEQPIRAFVGPGKYQTDPSEQFTGARFNWMPPDLDQLFIPDVVDDQTKELTKTGRAALSHIRQGRLEGMSFAEEWRLAPGSLKGKTVWMLGDIKVH